MSAAASSDQRVRVWDGFVRVFHWSIAVLTPFSWWSAKTGHLPWHRLSGYLILALVIFRVTWGLVGSQSARFSDFIRGPKTLLDYVRGRAGLFSGHSPLGGLNVASMIGALAVQVALGLFSVDEDGLEPGPLSKYLDFDTGRAVARVHHLTFYLLLALIVLHLAAVAIYEIRKHELVWAMITGRKPLPAGVLPPRMARPWVAFVVALFAGALAWIIAHGLRLTGPV